MKFKKILFWLIIILAAVLRLWSLSHYPAGLNADEAAIGYNAYSLIQTGQDEHGVSWPIHFKSFGDYKPGLYFYLVLPLVKFLGLNIWAVRLPSAILGILSVILLYLLIKQLFNKENWALLAAFFLAISPWHLQFSRGGWEANVAGFFILLGTWFFFKGFKSKKYLIFSVVAYVASLYTYHSARIIVPLLGLGLLLLYRRKIFRKAQLKWLLWAGGIGLALLIPLIISFLGPAGVSRFAGVGLLSDSGPFWRVNELRGQHPISWSLPVRLLHNRLVAYGLAFFENWLDHFHGEFLFLSGDVIERSRVPETGQMYLFDILFVTLGFYSLLKNRPQNWSVIFLWLVVAPVAAAMTFQTPHALRANTMVIPLVMISAYGALNLFDWLRKKKRVIKIIFYLFLFLLIPWNFAHYLHQYYVHYPQTYPAAWEYGFDQLVPYLQGIEDECDRIYVTDKYDQPYILFLFYLKYPPEKFQQEVKLTPRDKFGFSTVRDFDKFHFEEIDWSKLKDEPNILIVAAPGEIPEADYDKIIKKIYFKNGQPAFLILKT